MLTLSTFLAWLVIHYAGLVSDYTLDRCPSRILLFEAKREHDKTTCELDVEYRMNTVKKLNHFWIATQMIELLGPCDKLTVVDRNGDGDGKVSETPLYYISF